MDSIFQHFFNFIFFWFSDLSSFSSEHHLLILHMSQSIFISTFNIFLFAIFVWFWIKPFFLLINMKKITFFLSKLRYGKVSQFFKISACFLSNGTHSSLLLRSRHLCFNNISVNHQNGNIFYIYFTYTYQNYSVRGFGVLVGIFKYQRTW